jgi:hypothetical protein
MSQKITIRKGQKTALCTEQSKGKVKKDVMKELFIGRFLEAIHLNGNLMRLRMPASGVILG